jgi:hypothetical protein
VPFAMCKLYCLFTSQYYTFNNKHGNLKWCGILVEIYGYRKKLGKYNRLKSTFSPDDMYVFYYVFEDPERTNKAKAEQLKR